MTNNEKLARWAGLKNVRPTVLSNGKTVILHNNNEIIPNYEGSNAALGLLDVLVEKGYEYLIDGDADCIEVEIFYADTSVVLTSKLSLSAAITSAILQLIESEENK